MAFAGILDPEKGMITLTDDQAERERELARQMLAQASQSQPIGHWTQGAAQVLQALGGVVKQNRAEGALKANRSYEADLLSKAFGGAPSQSGGAASVGMSGGASGDMVPYQNAIAGIESGGNYGAVGPTHPKMGRALGKYQVMEANVGPWSQAALGRAVSPDEFLASPEIQDAVFNSQFGQYVQKYGPEKAAQAWFAGPGGIGTNRQDSLGTSVPEYARKFTAALGQGGEAQPMPFNPAQAQPATAQAMPFDPQSAPAPQMQAMGNPVRVASANANDANPVLMALAQRAGAVPQQGGMSPQMAGQMAPAPQQVAQAPQAPQGSGLPREALVQALTSGRLSPGGQAVVRSLLEADMRRQEAQQRAQMEAADPLRQIQIEKARLEVEGLRNPMPKPTDDMREYDYAKSQGFQGTFQDYQIALKEAGRPSTSVNIDQKAQGALEKSLGEQVGKTFATMYEEGAQAGQDIYQIDRLRGLLQQSGSGLGPALANAAAGFGIKLTEGADAGQAANAIISYLTPRMRVPGTGASSDRDVSLFQKALPSLLNTPDGNAMILETMQGLAEYKRAQGDIAGLVVMGEIDPKDAAKQIRALPDPFARFKAAQKPAQNGTAQPSGIQDGSTAYNPQTGETIIFRNGKWGPML